MFKLIDYETHFTLEKNESMLLEKTIIDTRLVNLYSVIAKCRRLFLYNHRKNIYLRSSMKVGNTNFLKNRGQIQRVINGIW